MLLVIDNHSFILGESTIHNYSMIFIHTVQSWSSIHPTSSFFSMAFISSVNIQLYESRCRKDPSRLPSMHSCIVFPLQQLLLYELPQPQRLWVQLFVHSLLEYARQCYQAKQWKELRNIRNDCRHHYPWHFRCWQ
mmetsp:Transcript_6829/g.16817  ORF Transcript_6829/g.16817 Transcript_6829/m.16817 type:complete len:135 (+) Transcript_6829:241-645(+)